MNSAKVIGVIPASGKATRLSPIPCSKEIFPVGFRYHQETEREIPKVIAEFLLENFRNANIEKAFFIIRQSKNDIPSYFASLKPDLPSLAYLFVEESPSICYTLDQLYPFAHDHLVALGFPDILVEPPDSFRILIQKLDESKSDVTLGLFPIEKKSKWDMVETSGDLVKKFVIKPASTLLQFGWSQAVWSPVFSEYLHEFVAKFNFDQPRELHIGHVFQQAINDGLKITQVTFPQGWCIDIGTPDDLKKLQKKLY